MMNIGCWVDLLHGALAVTIARGTIVFLLFWFLPPLWLAYTALLREAETCCDQQVINRGFRGSVYARTLLDLARDNSGDFLLPAASAALGRSGGLEARIRNLMSLRPGRQLFGVLDAMRVLAIFVLCLLPLLAVTCGTKPSLVRYDDPDGEAQVRTVLKIRGEKPAEMVLIIAPLEGRGCCVYYRR